MATVRPKSERGRLELQEIKRLIEMIERSPITEFELVDKDLRIRISNNGKQSSPLVTAPAVAVPIVTSAPAAAPSDGVAPSAPTVPAKTTAAHEVKSPW